jgi:hypothetical protein
MTLIYERQVQGAAAHALVIGVGAYPWAKREFVKNKAQKELRNVSDLPSAAAGAHAFCDWLIGEALPPVPLATIEMLKNGPDPVHNEYSWQGRIHAADAADPRVDATVEAPTTTLVQAAGERWVEKLKSTLWNVGLLYICGHGALISWHAVVFLADLNKNSNDPWNAFLDVHHTAFGLKQVDEINAAHLFVDACAEKVPGLEAWQLGGGCVKFVLVDPFQRGVEKVSLLAAAAPNYLAYEDKCDTGGRFTLTLLRGLRGTAARNVNGEERWIALPHGIHQDLKHLYSLQSAWGRQPFEPAPPLLPSEALPIVVFNTPPQITLRIRLDPEIAIKAGDAYILDSAKTKPPLYSWPKNGTIEWTLAMQASIWPHWIVAEFPPGGTYTNQELHFFPTQSLFNKRINVAQ